MDQGSEHPLSATQADVDATQRTIQQLQAELQRSFDSGNASLSASIAESLTRFTQQLKTQRELVEQSAALHSAEQRWLSDQLSKVNSIKAVVEAKRREVELIQLALRNFLASPQSPDPPSSSHSSSFLSHVFSPSPSPSPHPPAPVTCSSLLVRARKSIKECQVTLEQQNLVVDSIDMNEHPTTLSAVSAQPSASLASMKAVRKDTVTYIHSQLQHVDAFEQHVVALEQFLAFLDKAPRPQYMGDEAKGRGGQEGGGARGGDGPKKKSGRR